MNGMLLHLDFIDDHRRYRWGNQALRDIFNDLESESARTRMTSDVVLTVWWKQEVSLSAEAAEVICDVNDRCVESGSIVRIYRHSSLWVWTRNATWLSTVVTTYFKGGIFPLLLFFDSGIEANAVSSDLYYVHMLVWSGRCSGLHDNRNRNSFYLHLICTRCRCFFNALTTAAAVGVLYDEHGPTVPVQCHKLPFIFNFVSFSINGL